MSLIERAFAASPFVRERMAAPLPLALAWFAHHFEVRDGAVVARDSAGKVLDSPTRPNKRASFEEAIEMLTTSSPDREYLLKPDGAEGAKKAISRADLEAMEPLTRAAHFDGGGTVFD